METSLGIFTGWIWRRHCYISVFVVILVPSLCGKYRWHSVARPLTSWTHTFIFSHSSAYGSRPFWSWSQLSTAERQGSTWSSQLITGPHELWLFTLRMLLEHEEIRHRKTPKNLVSSYISFPPAQWRGWTDGSGQLAAVCCFHQANSSCCCYTNLLMCECVFPPAYTGAWRYGSSESTLCRCFSITGSVLCVHLLFGGGLRASLGATCLWIIAVNRGWSECGYNWVVLYCCLQMCACVCTHRSALNSLFQYSSSSLFLQMFCFVARIPPVVSPSVPSI